MNIQNKSGLVFNFLESGIISCIEVHDVRLNLKKASPFTFPPVNIYLRIHSETINYFSLFNEKFAFKDDHYFTSGRWNNIEYFCVLELMEHDSSWKWTVSLKNFDIKSIKVDLIYFHEVGLKMVSEGLVNEYYVAQYLERIIFEDPVYGRVICCRQNMKEAGNNPWLLLACTDKADSALTDGYQFFGSSCRNTGIPEALFIDNFPGNLAAESPYVALQSQMMIVDPLREVKTGFIGIFQKNKKDASNPNDLDIIAQYLNRFNSKSYNEVDLNWKNFISDLNDNIPFLNCSDLNIEEIEHYFGTDQRHKEFFKGQLISFFYDQSHVMLKNKELLTYRPHAHILQANVAFEPDESVMSTTCFATGIFNSHVSQGNTNFNVVLSINTSQFNLNRLCGQRIFIEQDSKLYQLGVPSAFEMGFNYCKWIYKLEHTTLVIRTWTSTSTPEIYLDFNVIYGKPIKLFVTNDFDSSNRWQIITSEVKNLFEVIPIQESMIKKKFPDTKFSFTIDCNVGFIKASCSENFISKLNCGVNEILVFEFENVKQFSITLKGDIFNSFNEWSSANFDKQISESQFFKSSLLSNLSLKGNDKNVAILSDILPWYGLNAMIHYLTPYGIEQFSGAAWGTRDVSQGPIELLLNTGKYREARKVLLNIFANQNSFGDWPQWWMFDSYREIRAGDCHGDIYYWVIIALSSYIEITDDFTILDTKVPYFGNDTALFSVEEHVERLIKMITSSFLPGTSLVPFGGGDWNDSLQPVNKELASKLISSWTVEMNYQAFEQYREVYSKLGKTDKSNHLAEICKNIKNDFNKYLVRDGIIAGYSLMKSEENIIVLLHPEDYLTGIRHSILPINRGVISGILSKEQAINNQNVISQFLKGPDGARLMDKPMKYKGGIQEIFQRAESSTYFGREIGLMYIHEHIRYAESQSILGNAEEFVNALRLAVPIDYEEVVSNSDLRQSNCYYTSSDAFFSSKYESDDKYSEILNGKRTVIGGWRVYSSGPGIFISLIINRLIGFRIENNKLIIDPVMPGYFDGMIATLKFLEYNLEIKYNVNSGCHTPNLINVNEVPINFDIEIQKYRNGGALLNIEDFKKMLHYGTNKIEIFI